MEWWMNGVVGGWSGRWMNRLMKAKIILESRVQKCESPGVCYSDLFCFFFFFFILNIILIIFQCWHLPQ